MDSPRHLFFILMVISGSEYSARAQSDCWNSDMEDFYLLKGEAFHFVPTDTSFCTDADKDFSWYKNSSRTGYISSNETERIHHHGSALLLLNLTTEDSGFYTGQCSGESQCLKFHVEIYVHSKRDTIRHYGEIKNSDKNKKVPCPDPVRDTCTKFNGRITWYKDSLPKDSHEPDLWIKNVRKDDEGVYTCICTWEHNHILYNSSGSRELILEESLSFNPQLDILLNKEQFADEGSETKLICHVVCGINILQEYCNASWNMNGAAFVNKKGYSQTFEIMTENLSKKTTATANLTIQRVSAQDFLDEFKCIGKSLYEENSSRLVLKRRASIIPLVIGGLFAFLLSVALAMLVKYFAIDLALLFRPYFPLSSHKKGAKLFDAYVVYQTPSGDKAAENMFCQFVSKILPSVLEEKCGYRLFIHGRDDIPGEDRLELVEDRMNQSSRLMVILTPGSGSEMDICPNSPLNAIGGFDWQVGLHQALVQREMNVILIQLGDPGPEGYSHLPPGLQHLIRCSAPIRWPESSKNAAMWNSRFWKRVRYLMPARPASKSPQAFII